MDKLIELFGGQCGVRRSKYRYLVFLEDSFCYEPLKFTFPDELKWSIDLYEPLVVPDATLVLPDLTYHAHPVFGFRFGIIESDLRVPASVSNKIYCHKCGYTEIYEDKFEYDVFCFKYKHQRYFQVADITGHYCDADIRRLIIPNLSKMACSILTDNPDLLNFYNFLPD